MQYLGGKFSTRKQIVEEISKYRESEEQYWVEPFMGACWVLSEVSGNRIGNDIHKPLVDMFLAIKAGWIPPKSISVEEYNHIKNNKNEYPSYLLGFVGFARDSRPKYSGDESFLKRGYESTLKKVLKLKGVDLFNHNYDDLYIPDESIIYCDPPYKNTCGYGYNFDTDKFWNWARKMKILGHTVFVSEYQAPEDIEILKEFSVKKRLQNDKNGNKLNVLEKLYKV